MKFLTLIAVISLLTGCFNRVDLRVSPSIDHVGPFYSAYVMPRNLDIWLPREYHANPAQRFPVLYMQDGQNLFNHSDATLGIAWDIDRVAQRLMDKGKIKPAIIVAIWSTPGRQSDYFPEKLFSPVSAADDAEDAPTPADNYLSFIVRELKPYMDKHYRTFADKNHTLIAGASMGGVVSLYALTKYPEVFGGVASLYTDWSSLFKYSPDAGARVIEYLENKLPAAGNHRFYFDLAATSHTEYPQSSQQRVNNIWREKHYQQGIDWVTREKAGAWGKENPLQVRADLMLEFLLGTQVKQQKF